MEEIEAERDRGNRVLQVSVAGGDDPDVDGNRLAAADSFKLPFLEHSQQRDLRFGGKLADFVQKNRSSRFR